MCLFPKIVLNKKYTPNKKNGGILPPVNDTRTLYVPSKCGNCMECRKQYARDWQIRLQEDIKSNTNAKFVTLTLSNDNYKELYNYTQNKIIIEINKIHNSNTSNKDIKIEQLTKLQSGYKLDNEIATNSIRLFLERWRKQHKKSIRHWLITELGQEGTENIHLHGLIWTNESYDEIEKHWQYGYIWPRKILNKKGQWLRETTYVNERTINYCVKYVYKQDLKHPRYKSIILSSSGIGKNYITNINGDVTKNKFNGDKTNETYRTRQGNKINLPTYYKNIIYTEQEKEELWLNKLNKQERWVLGQKIDISNGEEEYYKALKSAQELNSKLGYRSRKNNWIKEQYEMERRNIQQKKRIQ